jgi:hypothetical protein
VTAPPTSSPEAAELDPNQEARYGSPEPPLESGFEPDPYSVAIISGGPINVAYLENGCVGYAEPNPDFEVQYTAGAQTLLRFYFVADTPGEDATLIINDPVSGWHCNDDFSDSTHDPSIDFSPPLSGYYDIWVGSYSSGDFVAGTLYITELSSNHP